MLRTIYATSNTGVRSLVDLEVRSLPLTWIKANTAGIIFAWLYTTLCVHKEPPERDY